MTRPPGSAANLSHWTALLIALLACLNSFQAVGLINPQLQPEDLYDRHRDVVIGHVTSVDKANASFTVKLTRSIKGEYKPDQTITITASTEAVKQALAFAIDSKDLARGNLWIGLASSVHARGRQQFKFYTNIGWGLGSMTSASDWRWDATELPSDESSLPLVGTWSGSPAMFASLMSDIAAGKAHFPRRAYMRFRPELPLLEADGPIRGVALYDIDHDGRLDIFLCSDAGDRLLLQIKSKEPGIPAFADATEYVGLATGTSRSCSFADVNGSGRADLLRDGVIYLAAEKRRDRFAEPSTLLPADAGVDLLASAFVEVNGDGWPDVVIARQTGGLRVLLHPGKPDAPYTDATDRLGLTIPDTDRGQSVGYFTAGDWNADGRTDLFHATATGRLLIQTEAGRFEPSAHLWNLDLVSGADRLPGRTGAGVFAPLLHPDRMDLLVPAERTWAIVANADHRPTDATPWGGEITEGSIRHLATVAADFDLDGRPDLYTITRRAHNRLLLNRGYGMFMHAIKLPHYDHVFADGDDSAHRLGANGIAVGDVDGDGAPDILLGNDEGLLTLLLNDTANLRTQPAENPIRDIERLRACGSVQVIIKGNRGVLGATVQLLDSTGRIVCMEQIGSNIATGCRGPDRAILTARDAGPHKVRVRYADGHVQTMDVDIKPRLYPLVTVSRP